MRFFNFRPKPFHPHFHLILTILVIKTQNMSENGEIYTAGREKKIKKKGNGMVTSTTYRQGEFRDICLWKGEDRDLQK